jgi:uncharacterized protein (UPF0548 family)
MAYRDWFGSVDDRALLRSLADREVNFTEHELTKPGWHRDERRTRLPDERPGEPEEAGSFQLGRRLIEQYEAPVPSIIRGLYESDSPLTGRNILLEGRFHGLHFYMGVRITEVIDEIRDGRERAWGWTYDTLQGHLERGRMSYEVVKRLDTGRVDFVTRGVSQRAPTVGPVLRLGWALFGRRTQLRFYRGCGERVLGIVTGARDGSRPLPEPVVRDGLVRAPSDAGQVQDQLRLRSEEPG